MICPVQESNSKSDGVGDAELGRYYYLRYSTRIELVVWLGVLEGRYGTGAYKWKIQVIGRKALGEGREEWDEMEGAAAGWERQ